ncbi:MAG: DUF5119 domain-containing protein [Lachnospiraceae bacterium]|nr:DUF5119 domain-containing protein [Lachnospiraceae bacterium]
MKHFATTSGYYDNNTIIEKMSLIESGHRLLPIGLCTLLQCIATGCVYDYSTCEEPEPTGTTVSVSFDFPSSLPAPEGMATLFYPMTGDSDYSRYDFRPSGGTVEINPGSYLTAVFNNDTESILFRGFSSLSSLEAYTRQGNVTDGLDRLYSGAMPPLGRVADLPVVIQPDMLMCEAPAAAIDIQPDTNTRIRFKPQQVVATYTITVNDISNLSSMRQGCLSLSGLCGNYLIGLSRKGDTVVTIPGSLKRDTNSSMTGKMLTFGYAPASASCLLRVYLWLRDGEKKVYEFDVTNQILNATDPLNVPITVGGITLPEIDDDYPDSPDGSLGVNVDNWETIDIELST